MRTRDWIVLIVATGLFTGQSFAQSVPTQVYDLPPVVAVQNRAAPVRHDLTAALGILPSDAFNKGLTLGLGYTYFFSDFLGWEVVQGVYSLNRSTGLKEDLLSCCQVEVENSGFGGALDYIQWYALSSVVYTPMYFKSLLFNQNVARGEISFVVGAGGAKFADTGVRPLVSVGLMMRLFRGETRSWKFDFRNNVYFEKSLGATNAMSIMIGYAWHFGAPRGQGVARVDSNP